MSRSEPTQNWKRLRNGTLDWALFRQRAAILKRIRRFFDDAGFLEIESPVITPYPTLDANIHSIPALLESESGSLPPFYLHTSPEHSMKKLLAAGAERIYYLGKVFRNREITPLHNPEFTLAEWYRRPGNYRNIMQDTETLIRTLFLEFLKSDRFSYQGRMLDLGAPWPVIPMNDLFKQRTSFSLESVKTVETFRSVLSRLGIPFLEDDDWETLFFRVYLERIEPGLGIPRPVFVTDYPVRLGLMARPKPGETKIVERVELYIGGLELANGYTELVDAQEQARRFHDERLKKRDRDGVDYPVDHDLLEALSSIPGECAGIALGLDRLIMLMNDRRHIADVLLFPVNQWQRAGNPKSGNGGHQGRKGRKSDISH